MLTLTRDETVTISFIPGLDFIGLGSRAWPIAQTIALFKNWPIATGAPSNLLKADGTVGTFDDLAFAKTCDFWDSVDDPDFKAPTLSQDTCGNSFVNLSNKVTAASSAPSPLAQIFPNGLTLGCFDTLFGDCRNNVIALLNTGAFVACRIQLFWDPTNNHSIVPLGTLVARLKLWTAIAAKYPHIKFYMSHTCEYNSQNISDIQQRINAIKSYCPNATAVNSPEGGSFSIAGILTEGHGNNVVAHDVLHSASWDGNECTDYNFPVWETAVAKAAYALAWIARFNMSHSGTNPSPAQRTYGPSGQLITAVSSLFIPYGVAPTPGFSGAAHANVPAFPMVWKAFAEDTVDPQGKADPRAQRPLLIAPQKSGAAYVLDMNGKQVGSLGYYDTYLSQGFRYYSGWKGPGWYAYQFANHAVKSAGSPFGYITVGGQLYGPFNLRSRAGYFETSVPGQS